MKRPILVIGVFLAYIFLLTGIFENFINKASSTMMTVLAIALFLMMTYMVYLFIRKQLKR